MTKTQYKRWKDFAFRAARVWYAKSRRPSAAWVLDAVEEFFSFFEDNEYTKHLSRFKKWDLTENPSRDPCDRFPYICDEVSRIGEEFFAPCFYWAVNEDDERDQKAYDHWTEQWWGPVTCCIRAGLDLAVTPSAGVIGFTAGDVRKLYPEGVPAWINRMKYFSTKAESWDIDPDTEHSFAEIPDDTGVML